VTKSLVHAAMIAAFSLAVGLIAHPARAAETGAGPEPCQAVMGADFSNVTDAPTQILEARAVAADAKHPAMCQVDGYVTPHVGFRLQLPANWNGKFIHIGCGGLCGVDFEEFDRDEIERIKPVMSCNPALRRGYACIRTDLGHKGGDAKWAYQNLQGQIDHGFRATHVTTLAGKAIVEWYYRQPPAKSYFMGCSGGGLQAMSEVQRFPWDFDGVIAGAVPLHGLTTRSTLADLWTYTISQDAAGKPILTMADIELLHRAVVARCDMNDGVKDGIIGDPRACKFDPGEVACGPAKTGGCLTPEKLDVVRKIYSGPTSPDGVKGFAGQVLGSELDWPQTVINGVHYVTYATEAMRYLFLDPAPGPAWTRKDFDITRDYKRLGVTEAIHAAQNPDLRTFKAAGGKLIMYVGWEDRGRALLMADYYETVERVMGGQAQTQDFARFFALPGVGHCFGGEGADKVDYLTALEDWVERGKAPDRLIAAKLKAPEKPGDFTYLVEDFPPDPQQVVFTRPLYPYPAQARYSGHGDPTKAESFRPVTPPATPK
jgi:feruloyl esterase